MIGAESPHATLRQMLALLEAERQALAALDLERIITCSTGKLNLCAQLETVERSALDEDSLGLLDAVRRLNEVNRRLRNLIATNIQTRLGSLSGAAGVYAGARSQGAAPAAV